MTPQARYYDAPEVVDRWTGLSDLLPAEEPIMARLRDELPAAAVLDIGVGGGRTTVHIAPLCRRYVGIDFAAAMVEACDRRFAGAGPEFADAKFEQADVRDLSRYATGSFEVVWFTHNGLDAVGGLDDRRQALREMARVCAPGGVLVFSSHNLNAVLRLGPMSVRRPRALLRTLAARRRMLQLNPRLRRAMATGQAMVHEQRRSGHVVDHYYIRPDVQVRELRALGLQEVETVGPSGEAITDEARLRRRSEPHIYYWARR